MDLPNAIKLRWTEDYNNEERVQILSKLASNDNEQLNIIFCYFSIKTNVVVTHKSGLKLMVL